MSVLLGYRFPHVSYRLTELKEYPNMNYKSTRRLYSQRGLAGRANEGRRRRSTDAVGGDTTTLTLAYTSFHRPVNLSPR